MERQVWRESHNKYKFAADDGAPVSGTVVTSKFGKARARALLLKNAQDLHSLIGVHGDSKTVGLQAGARNYEPVLGCDPELFLGDAEGQVIPAFNVLPGKQTNPKTFWDGFQAEFTVHPAACLQNLQSYVMGNMGTLLSLARAANPRVRPLATDVIEIPEAMMKTASDEHAALGCDPSFNLYGMSSDIPRDGRALRYRFAGGHIHFGDARLVTDHEYAAQTVYNLDMILAVWSVAAAANYEKTKVRRKFYGLAGEFRLPKHGLEYRTLSNFWLMDPALFHITFELARVIYRATSYGLLDFWHSSQQETIDTVNNYDVDTARKILRRNEKLFTTLLAASNSSWATSLRIADAFFSSTPEKIAKAALGVGLEGMESVMRSPDMQLNWEQMRTTGGYYWKRTFLTAIAQRA